MKIDLKVLAFSILAGLVLGFIGGPVQILALWAIVGISIGYLSSHLRAGLLCGAVFGFAVSFVFMLHGYSGIDPLSSKIIPFAALGVFGSLCGMVLALIGRLIRSLLLKRV